MSFSKTVYVFGDSILHGVQLREGDNKYVLNNHIDTKRLNDEYSLDIRNYSKFGCTVTKGEKILDRALERGMDCSAVILEYGGNDCDFDWKSIAESPESTHLPKTPIDRFCEVYRNMMKKLLSKNIIPIPTTLPPVISHRYLDWLCGKSLDKASVMRWLGDTENISHYQENYSRAVEKIAFELGVPLIDLRGDFLKNRHLENCMCADGIHPNTAGQGIMSETFYNFAGSFFGGKAVPAVV